MYQVCLENYLSSSLLLLLYHERLRWENKSLCMQTFCVCVCVCWYGKIILSRSNSGACQKFISLRHIFASAAAEKNFYFPICCCKSLHITSSIMKFARYMCVMWENTNINPSTQQHDNPQNKLFFRIHSTTMTPQLWRVGVNEFCMLILFKFNWFRHATHTHSQFWLMASVISQRRCCSLFFR